MLAMSIMVGIISDDLTGACDAGGQFAGRFGGPAAKVVVWIDIGNILPYRYGLPDIDLPEGARVSDGSVDVPLTMTVIDMLVINTQSRSLQSGAAYRLAREAAERLSELEPSLLLKKIDTAFRGNPGAEIDGVMDGSGVDVAAIVSSIPSLGRTTAGGRQLVGGRPLEETLFAGDPVCPVLDSDVVKVLRWQCKRNVTGLGLDAVRGGELLRAVKKAWDDGARVIAFDSETDGDIETIVNEMMRLGRKVLYVGSLGLAKGLARRLARRPARGAVTPGPATPRPDVPECGTAILGFSGTTYQETRNQLRRALETGRAEVIELDPVQLVEGVFEEGGARGEGLIGAVAANLDRGINVFVTLSEDSELVSGEVGTGFSRIARLVCEKTRFGALVLIGGETSYGICKLLGVERIVIEDCISTVMALGRLEGGIASGKRVAIKGGSVGDEDIILRAIDSIARCSA